MHAISDRGNSNLTVERYIAMCKVVDDLDFSILRSANVYGPRHGQYGGSGVIAIFAGRTVERRPWITIGIDAPTRDVVFIEDSAERDGRRSVSPDDGVNRTVDDRKRRSVG